MKSKRKKALKKEAPFIRKEGRFIVSNCPTQRCRCRPKSSDKPAPKCRYCKGLGLVRRIPPKVGKVTATYWDEGDQDRPFFSENLSAGGKLCHVDFGTAKGRIRTEIRNGELWLTTDGLSTDGLIVMPKFSNQVTVRIFKHFN